MERSTITERIGEMKHKTLWKWFAMALGEKASKCDNESDIVARIRAGIFLTYLITNCFIVAGVIKHWNDEQPIEIYIDNSVPSSLPQTQTQGALLKTSGIVSLY
jgi:hypothetical protein